ncbi:MAG TPA: CBS domain-containing protein [Rhodocyclaceae bacterium]|nr:CBS domain-containing protein [Rhodocyclaceae bacterium]
MKSMKLGSASAIMKKRLITATPYETVAVAADRMSEYNLGALLIVENDRLVGIFSERDILHRVVSRRKDPETTTLKQVLTPNPSTVTLETSIEKCIELIKTRGFRHLPVINEFRNPIGVVYSRDLLQYILGAIEERHHDEGDLSEIFGPKRSRETRRDDHARIP